MRYKIIITSLIVIFVFFMAKNIIIKNEVWSVK
jgi:hypothetical protein